MFNKLDCLGILIYLVPSYFDLQMYIEPSQSNYSSIIAFYNKRHNFKVYVQTESISISCQKYHLINRFYLHFTPDSNSIIYIKKKL